MGLVPLGALQIALKAIKCTPGSARFVGRANRVIPTFKFNISDCTTSLSCVSACCGSNSQLNGTHGEATNSDDVKSRVDRKQTQQIRKLQQQLRRMALVRNPGPPKRNKQKKRVIPKQRRVAPVPFPGIPSTSDLDQQPVVAHRDPVVVSTVAQLAPFRVPRGVSNLLLNGRPSQKFTARALLNLSMNAGQEAIMHLSPCVASDNACKSAEVFMGTKANLLAGAFSATTTPTGLTVTAAVTNTPYTFATLGGNDYQWRLVSAGYRVRNTTAAVNRQGILKWNVDHESKLGDYTNPATTHGGLIDAIDSSHRTVRRNMSTHPEADIVLSGQLFKDNVDWRSQASTSAPDTFMWPLCQARYEMNAHYYGVGAGIIVFPNTAVAQTYDVEIVEHWEVHGSGIETLHTPSGTHSGSAETVANIIKQAHHQHGLTPSMALHDVAKGVAYGEHHKAALKDAASVAAAIALL